MVMLCAPLLIPRTPLWTALNQQSGTDRGKTAVPAKKPTLDEITNQLKRSVNGKAVVHNECQSQGRAVQVEEGTEITEVSGCKVTFKTRKTSTSSEGQRVLEFTMYANLAELTTPASVEPQAFAQCQATEGAVLRVVSQAQPGRKIRTARRATSELANGTQNAGQPGQEITRKDLSLFFADPVAAKRAALALDHAVEACGGKEWPDEDDLP
jgi:exonuclease VII large subunit